MSNKGKSTKGPNSLSCFLCFKVFNKLDNFNTNTKSAEIVKNIAAFRYQDELWFVSMPDGCTNPGETIPTSLFSNSAFLTPGTSLGIKLPCITNMLVNHMQPAHYFSLQGEGRGKPQANKAFFLLLGFQKPSHSLSSHFIP